MAARRKPQARYLPESRQNDDLEELVVFGYACKLFRDDERAEDIDNGHHLIPWMGKDDITIDRYDGRGHLFDLRPFVGGNLSGGSGLSEEEMRIESLCDEERYLELHTDIQEKAQYEEEELKRLNEAVNDGYQAVGFSYDFSSNYDPSQPTEEAYQDAEEEEEDDEVFEVPETLKIPEGMIVPQAIKINAIIEKTALFVSQHGAQMEIVLKTKQSSNPQFGFLYLGDDLNPYYKHMVQMIKSGRYIPLPPKPSRQHSHPESDEDDEHSHSGYLHPSLAPRPSTVTQLKTSQIEGTAYAKLLTKLGKQLGQNSPNRTQQGAPPQSVYSATVQSYVTRGSIYGQSNAPPPPGMEPVSHPSQPPPPGTVPAQLPVAQTRIGDGFPVIGPQVIPPPPDMKPIIDRMAGYVIKEGLEFEAQVKSQNDPRFEFLQPWHTHYGYYEQKKKSLAQEILTLLQDENSKMAPKAVSFSIKAKEAETASLEKKKKAFQFHEESDDEDGNKIKPVTDELDSVMFDRPPPTEQNEKKLVAISAEDRLKDKLAAAAREKLAQTSKERQLQAERKRKAAMFASMVKQTGELKETGTGSSSKPSSRTHSRSPSPFSSPNLLRGSSTRTHSHSRSPSRHQSRSPPAYYRPERGGGRSSSSRSSRRRRSPSPRSKKRKTPPKAFATARRSQSPPKRRKRRSASSSDSDSSPKKKSKSRKSRSRRSRSRSRGSRNSRSKRSRSRNRSSKSTAVSKRRTRSSSTSSSSSSDNELIKSPSPAALARLGATKSSGLVKALLGCAGEDSSTMERPSENSTSDGIDTTSSEPIVIKDGDTSNAATEDPEGKTVSTDMLSKVRAMLKASRETTVKDEVIEIIDS